MAKKRKKKTTAKKSAENKPAEEEKSVCEETGAVKGASKVAAAAKKAYASAAKGVETVAEKVVDSVVGGDGGGMVPASMLREAENKRDEYLRLAQTTHAELDNFRKRVQRDRESWKRDSLGDFLKNFFGAFDDLDRAITEGEKNKDFDSFSEGVKLVRNNLWGVLEKAGVERIEALGNKFDPKVHEAMAMVPAPDKEPNTVFEVFQNGYKLDDFVLRPAKVIVAAPEA